MRMLRPLLLTTLVVVSLFSSTVNAEVRLLRIFGSYMVLQRGIEIPVWGWAEAGEAVSVSLGEETATVKADQDGRWKGRLPSMKAGGLTL